MNNFLFLVLAIAVTVNAKTSSKLSKMRGYDAQEITNVEMEARHVGLDTQEYLEADDEEIQELHTRGEEESLAISARQAQYRELLRPKDFNCGCCEHYLRISHACAKGLPGKDECCPIYNPLNLFMKTCVDNAPNQCVKIGADKKATVVGDCKPKYDKIITVSVYCRPPAGGIKLYTVKIKNHIACACVTVKTD